MNPKPAAKEDDIAEAIDVWEEKVIRLARHGDDYRLPETIRKVALEQMLVGNIRDNYELWEVEKLLSEDLLRKVKEQPRTNKLDRDAKRGKSGVATGPNLGNQKAWQEKGRERDIEGRISSTTDQPEEYLNAYQTGTKGKK
ncbi:hypothetical protein N9L68_01635 [bacterium]|nr:hypothetical protein [bacterium]